MTAKLEGKHTFKMMLDTGATHTTFDSTALYLAGFEIGNKMMIGKGVAETAGGVIDVSIFEVESLTAFGRTKHKMPIQVYDFFAYGILSDYDGLLGLDFFENTVLCIDMKNNTIEVR